MGVVARSEGRKEDLRPEPEKGSSMRGCRREDLLLGSSTERRWELLLAEESRGRRDLRWE